VQLEGLSQLKSNDLIGNRALDLPACSIVPQPTTQTRIGEYVELAVYLANELNCPMMQLSLISL
jgi:hypothetical protein